MLPQALQSLSNVTVPQAVFYIGNQLAQVPNYLKAIPNEWVKGVADVFETAIRTGQRLPHFLARELSLEKACFIRSNLIGNFHLVEAISNIVNAGILYSSSKTLYEVVMKNYGASILALNGNMVVGGGLCAAALLTYAIYKGIKKYNLYISRPDQSLAANLRAHLQEELADPNNIALLPHAVAAEPTTTRYQRAFYFTGQLYIALTPEEQQDPVNVTHLLRLRNLATIEADCYNNQRWSINSTHTASQITSQFFLTLRIIVNVALLYFSGPSLSLAVGTLGNAYCIRKIAQTSWLQFNRFIARTPQPFDQIRFSQINISYNILMQPHIHEAQPVALEEPEDCPICLDPLNNQASTEFCGTRPDHVIHTACLIRNIYQTSQRFGNLQDIRRTATHHYRDGIYTGTTYSYSVEVPEANLPICLPCNTAPKQNYFSISVRDDDHGTYNAAVHIIPTNPPVDRPSYKFEKFDLIYSAFRSAMFFLQSYSELASAVLKTHRYMVWVDVAMALPLYYKLLKAAKVKFEEEFPQRAIWQFYVAAAVSTVAATALAWYGAAIMHALLQPKTDLKSLLPSSLNFTATVLDWKTPFNYHVMQTAYIMRIIGNVAMSFFSERPKLHLASAAVQTCGLAQLFSFVWIHLQATYSFPLKNTDFKVFDSYSQPAAMQAIFKRDVQEIVADSYHMIDPAATKDANLLTASVKKIADCFQNLFTHSTWEAYFKDHAFYYGIKLRLDALLPEWQLPSLGELNFWGKDFLYGAAKVELL